jgi:hypothetical protein
MVGAETSEALPSSGEPGVSRGALNRCRTKAGTKRDFAVTGGELLRSVLLEGQQSDLGREEGCGRRCSCSLWDGAGGGLERGASRRASARAYRTRRSRRCPRGMQCT